METTMATRLPKVLANFRSDCPKVDMRISTGPTRRLLQQVTDRELDCALVAGPVSSDLLDQVAVLQEELVVVSSTRWTSLEDYFGGSASPTVLVFREGCSYRECFLNALTSLGHRTFAKAEFGTLGGILGCVECDIGVTMMPREVVIRAANGAGLRIHDLPADRSRVETLLVRRRDMFEGVGFRRFQDWLMEAWRP